MDIIDIIKTRRSVRDFIDREIPESAVAVLAEALRWAPSAGNLQSRKFYFVFNHAVRNQLAGTGYRENFVSFIAQAPLVIVACADHNIASLYGERGLHLYCLQDSAASIQNLLLAAHALGLGACWVGAFKEDKVRAVLSLPSNLRPVAMVPVGYPARTPGVTERVSTQDAVAMIV